MKTEPSEEESPTQVQQRNVREAEMLTSNLGEGGISQQEILSDVGVLKELAILQESMEWFASRITEFAHDLKKPIVNGLVAASPVTTPGSPSPAGTATIVNSPVIVKDGMIKVLINLALEFEELANTCLLVLHLEVRVQCFHYLRSSPSDRYKANNPNKNDSLEPDAKVLKLTKVLSDMDEALSSTLHPRKTKVSEWRIRSTAVFYNRSPFFAVRLRRVGTSGRPHSHHGRQLDGIHRPFGRAANVPECASTAANAEQHYGVA